MSAPLRLEVFETPGEPEAPSLVMPEDLEDLKLNAYERGYTAGWDDAMRQASDETRARHEALARMAEGLSFTFHEAQAHVLGALEPLLQAIAAQILPELARAALVQAVGEELMSVAATLAGTPVELRVPAGKRDAFEEGFEGLVLPPLEIVECDDLAEGVAEFAADARHTRVDLAGVADRLADAITRFYQTDMPQKEAVNG
ncbi:MAG: hypothetical protein JJT95_09715 [Pararhodobacter sp.]|nr:hypothetical protein [Pararhodobacter sp.]